MSSIILPSVRLIFKLLHRHRWAFRQILGPAGKIIDGTKIAENMIGG
jgi:hypothetical protein